ncbi:MAG: exodeoxyribonuclease VII small subunit [Bacteroidales bacterium]|nr:exodeoxyribonuclease VII small subunit [Bacteroidales bacterium]
MTKTQNYTEAIKELEKIVAKLQSPDCDVDELCNLTAKAIELLNFCKDKLTKVDKDLAKLLEKIDNN